MLLVEISTESIYWSKYLRRSVTISLSECDVRSVRYTKRLRGSAVLYCSPAQGQWCGEYATSPWWCGVYATSPSNEVGELSGLWYTFSIWPYAGHAQSRYLYGTEIWLRTLAPAIEELAWLNEEKNLNRIKNHLSIEWEWCISRAISLDTNNQAYVFVESGES